ncbi:MAG: PilZ domain-containing protein [Gammaproteobacteria bacterium]|nr:PilZ domain-containing protein [Gammaproteobacteria bacterium]
MTPEPNKRHFSRISFREPIRIISHGGNSWWTCSLLDISLHGALTSMPEHWRPHIGDDFKLELQLGRDQDEDLLLKMNVRVSHIDKDHVGFEIEDMDLNTADHLRRLVELNLGDEEILQRNIEELIRQNSARQHSRA